MTLDKRLKETLCDGEIKTIRPNLYTGSEKRYFVYDYRVAPDLFADDEPGVLRYNVTVHYICPLSEDSVARRKKIRKQLFAAGFTYPTEINASDEVTQDYIFEFEWVEEVDENG